MIPLKLWNTLRHQNFNNIDWIDRFFVFTAFLVSVWWPPLSSPCSLISVYQLRIFLFWRNNSSDYFLQCLTGICSIRECCIVTITADFLSRTFRTALLFITNKLLMSLSSKLLLNSISWLVFFCILARWSVDCWLNNFINIVPTLCIIYLLFILNVCVVWMVIILKYLIQSIRLIVI